MTDHDDLERALRAHLDRRAPSPPVGLLDGLLRQTAALPQRRVLTFAGLAGWGAGLAAAAILLVAALALRSGLPGPSTPPGAHTSPSASAAESLTTITVPSPVHEKAIMLQAQDVMSARLRALGIGNFTAAAGDDLTFSFILPPSVDQADVDTVLNAPGDIEWLAWSEAPWPVEGDAVREDVFPLFDASDQILSATVRPASGGSPEGVVVSLGPVAWEAIAAYTSAHVGEPALPLAMDGTVLTSPTIHAPITGGDIIITAGIDGPISTQALAAILSSGPLPAAWTATSEIGVHVSCQPESCPTGRVLIEIGSTAWEAQDANGTALTLADSAVQLRNVSQP